MRCDPFLLLMEDIRRSPVEVHSLSPLFTVFFTSQVVQDLSHQQVCHAYADTIFFKRGESPYV